MGSGGPPGTGRGTLLRWLDAAVPAGRIPPQARLIVQAGSEEDELQRASAELADLLAPTGAVLGHRVIAGGHDHAWWRHGLSHALDLVECSAW